MTLVFLSPAESPVVAAPVGAVAVRCRSRLSGHGLGPRQLARLDRRRLTAITVHDLTGSVLTVTDARHTRHRLFHHDPDLLRRCVERADRLSWDGGVILVVESDDRAAVALHVDDADDPIEPLCDDDAGRAGRATPNA